MCAKVHASNSKRSRDMSVQSFQFVAVAPPIDASGSNQIACIFVPAYTPPPSLVRIGGLVLELSW